jgi:hypothetical protein
MANNVQFESSVPATPSSATLVQTIQQPDTSQRQVISVGDFWGSSAGAISVTLSSNPTVIPSSNTTVVISGTPTVVLSSNPTVIISSQQTVTLSSQPTVSLSSAVTVNSGTITLSSNPTVIPSSVWTVSVSSGTVTLSSAPTVTLSSAITINSGTVTLSSNPTVIPSSVFTVTLSSNPTVIPSSQQTVTLSSAVTVNSGTITLSSNPTVIVSSNVTITPSSVFIVNSVLRSLKGVQLTAISCSTAETNITPAGSAGIFTDLYGLVLSNQSTGNTQVVTIKDSSGGTARTVFTVPPNDTRGFMLPGDAGIPQSGSSQSWTATLSNSSGAFNVTALYIT